MTTLGSSNSSGDYVIKERFLDYSFERISYQRHEYFSETCYYNVFAFLFGVLANLIGV